MRRFCLKMFVLFILMGLQTVIAKEKIDDPFDLDEIIKIINISLDKVSEEVDLVKAEIVLSRSFSDKFNGGFSFFWSSKKDWQEDNNSTLTFTYEPSSTKGGQKNLSDNLNRSVLNAVGLWKKSKLKIDGLKNTYYTVDVKFMLSEDAKHGLNLELFGVELAASDNSIVKSSHSVKLTFKK